MTKTTKCSDEKASLIRKIPFFANLTDSELQEVSRRFIEREFKKGDHLFWEGESSGCLYAIKEGRVKVLRHLVTGKKIVFEVLTAGDICGASGVFAGTQIASALAVEKTRVYILSREDFVFLLDRHGGLAREVIAYLGQKLAKLHDMIIALVSGKAEQRIASLLLGLSERHGSPVSGGTRIDVSLTRQDIADIVGTTVETAIRVMSRFKRQGIVLLSSGEIIVTDREQLRRVARSGGGDSEPGPLGRRP